MIQIITINHNDQLRLTTNVKFDIFLYELTSQTSRWHLNANIYKHLKNFYFCAKLM